MGAVPRLLTGEDRSAFHHAVTGAVRNIDPDLSVRGSFERGDFHLSARPDDTSLWSFSDLDLLKPGYHGDERFELAQLVRQGVHDATGLLLPVSVQGADHFTDLSCRDSTLLAVAEYVRQDCQSESDARRTYQRAKLILRLASATGSNHRPELILLRRIKRGEASSDLPPVDWDKALMMPGVDPDISQLAREAMRPDDLPTVARQLQRHIRQCATVSPWLASLFQQLLQPAAEVSTGTVLES